LRDNKNYFSETKKNFSNEIKINNNKITKISLLYYLVNERFKLRAVKMGNPVRPGLTQHGLMI